MADWPGYDEPAFDYRPPVVRPKGPRYRHGSEAYATQTKVVVDSNGNLLMPVPAEQFGRINRSSSVSGGRPAQIVINNDNGASQQYLDERPHSSHGHHRRPSSSVYYDERPRLRARSRRRSRGSPYVSDYSDYEYDEYDRRGGRVVRYHHSRHNSNDSRSKSRDRKPKRSAEDEAMIKELEDMKKKQEDEELAKKVEEELLLKKLKEERDRKIRDEADKKLKDKAIEEYKLKVAAEEERKKKVKEEEEERMITLLMANKPNMSERDARKWLKRAEKRREGVLREDDDDDDDDDDGRKERRKGRRDELGRVRPTYIKVHMRHLSPETLDLYRLPWEWDERDSGYIIIKQWVSESDQEILFNDTKQRKERSRLTYPRDKLKADSNQIVFVKEKEKRKKSPIKKTSWFLT